MTMPEVPNCKSGIAIFAWRVTWNNINSYIYFPVSLCIPVPFIQLYLCILVSLYLCTFVSLHTYLSLYTCMLVYPFISVFLYSCLNLYPCTLYPFISLYPCILHYPCIPVSLYLTISIFINHLCIPVSLYTCSLVYLLCTYILNYFFTHLTTIHEYLCIPGYLNPWFLL